MNSKERLRKSRLFLCLALPVLSVVLASCDSQAANSSELPVPRPVPTPVFVPEQPTYLLPFASTPAAPVETPVIVVTPDPIEHDFPKVLQQTEHGFRFESTSPKITIDFITSSKDDGASYYMLQVSGSDFPDTAQCQLQYGPENMPESWGTSHCNSWNQASGGKEFHPNEWNQRNPILLVIDQNPANKPTVIDITAAVHELSKKIPK